MRISLLKKKKEIGLSPYESTFIGEQKMEKPELSLIDFTKDHIERVEVVDMDQIKEFKEKNSFTWLNVDGVHDPSPLNAIANIFDLEPTIIPEIMDTQTRPHAKEYDNCVLVSFRALRASNEADDISCDTVSVVCSSDWIISFRERKMPLFDPIIDRMKREHSRIRKQGVDYLMFTLLDVIIDNYMYILSLLGDKIEKVEDELLDEADQSLAKEINAYKKELNFIRKNTKPMNEVLLNLTKMDEDTINDMVTFHLKELRNSMLLVNDEIESYREILGDQSNLYNTTVNNLLNDRIKFLTIFSVIFIPLTFIVGVYGTNFDILPELHFKYSYYVMWMVMIIIAIGMIIYFKIKNWF